VTGGWKELHGQGPHTLCCSQIVVRVIKSRRVRWTGHHGKHGGDETYT
jgi:hypothetical protein